MTLTALLRSRIQGEPLLVVFDGTPSGNQLVVVVRTSFPKTCALQQSRFRLPVGHASATRGQYCLSSASTPFSSETGRNHRRVGANKCEVGTNKQAASSKHNHDDTIRGTHGRYLYVPYVHVRDGHGARVLGAVSSATSERLDLVDV